MEQMFLDMNEKPYSNEEITESMINAFSNHLPDEEVNFSILFDVVKEKLSENAFYAMNKNFADCDLFHYNKLTVNQQRRLLEKITGTSFAVEFNDGILVYCESFIKFFDSLLRKDFETSNIIKVEQTINESTDVAKNFYVFSDEIENPEKYNKILSVLNTYKVFGKDVELTLCADTVKKLKRSLTKFLHNIKISMENEYKKEIKEKVNKTDLSGYLNKIITVTEENQHLC